MSKGVPFYSRENSPNPAAGSSFKLDSFRSSMSDDRRKNSYRPSGFIDSNKSNSNEQRLFERSSGSLKLRSLPKIQIMSPVKRNTGRDISLLNINIVNTDSELKNKEVQSLAKAIGIETEEEFEEFKWLIELMVESKLPHGWIKEIDPTGQIVYYDTLTELITLKHPQIISFTNTFLEVLNMQKDGDKDFYTRKFKLEDIVQPLNEILSPEKKKYAIKRKNGKRKAAVIRKKEISEEQKKSIDSSLDISKQQEQISKKESNVSNLFEKNDERLKLIQSYLDESYCKDITIEQLRKASLIESEALFKDYRRFYFNLFFTKINGNWLNLFDYLEGSYENYRAANLEDVLVSIELLRIPINKSYLFWIARMYCSLELPISCELRLKNNESYLAKYPIFVHRQLNLYLEYHPSFYFAREMVIFVEKQKSIDSLKIEKFSANHTFYTQFNVPFQINLIDKLKEKINSELPPKINKLKAVMPKLITQIKVTKELQRRVSQAKLINFSASQLNIIDQRKTERKKEGSDMFSVFSQEKEATVDPKENRDYHILEIAKQLNINIAENSHLLSIHISNRRPSLQFFNKVFINEFIDVKNRKEERKKWYFRLLGRGCYWINHIEKRAVREYPYLAEIKVAINKYNREIKRELNRTLKRKKIKNIMRNFVIEDFEQVKELLNLEAKELVKWNLLKNKDTEPYKLKYIGKYLKNESLKQDKIMSLIFNSVFDLHK